MSRDYSKKSTRGQILIFPTVYTMALDPFGNNFSAKARNITLCISDPFHKLQSRDNLLSILKMYGASSFDLMPQPLGSQLEMVLVSICLIDSNSDISHFNKYYCLYSE